MTCSTTSALMPPKAKPRAIVGRDGKHRLDGVVLRPRMTMPFSIADDVGPIANLWTATLAIFIPSR